MKLRPFVIILFAFASLGPASTLAMAARDSLNITEDARIMGLGSGGTVALTYNGGAVTYAQLGWRLSTDPANIDSMYGKAILGVDISSIPDAHTIDNMYIGWYNDQAIANAPEMACFGVPSNWVEGTKSTIGYEFGSVSYNNRGNVGFTYVNGIASTNDSVWTSGEKHGSRYLSTVNVTTQNAWNLSDVTAMAVDSHAAGVNYLSFLFYDTLFPGGGSYERCTMVLSDNASLKPYAIVEHSLHTPPDSTWLRITVSPPSSPLSDYPVQLSFLTYPDKANHALTFYASDSTTKLYWCPDSLSGHYTRAWVKHDWSSDPDTIFVRRQSNPGYMNCDSVFLLYEDWTQSFSAASPVTDWDNYSATIFDTVGPILLGEADTTVWADEEQREGGGIIRDWQETTDSLRYKHFYTGARNRSDAPDVRYNDNFLLLAAAPSLSADWQKIDTVFFDSSGVRTPMHAEDPSIKWFPNLNKWVMVNENHQVSLDYHVGLFLADSLDQPEWVFHGNIPLLEPSALGSPTNWLDKEQASPAFLFYYPEEDTAWFTFEALNSAGNSYMGLAISYDDPAAGDTLGLDWHLCDSTAAVNDENPTPLVPWGITAQNDSAHNIPDGFYYLNGEFIVSNHGAGPHIEYKGATIRDLVYQPLDSSHFAEHWSFDSTDGNFIGVLVDSFTGYYNVTYLMRQRDWDTLRMPDSSPFTLHNRAGKLGGYNRTWGCEASANGGKLTMYPSQFQTGTAALLSKNEFEPGFILEMWAALTSYGDGTLHTNVSFGRPTIQDYLSTQSAWWDTELDSSYTFNFHPNAARWYRDTTTTHVSIGGAITLDANYDTLTALHKWSFWISDSDSLNMYIDDVAYARRKDTKYTGVNKHILISQGERRYFDRGAILHIDKIQVRPFTGENATATATDTLYYSMLQQQLPWFNTNPFGQLPYNQKPFQQ